MFNMRSTSRVANKHTTPPMAISTHSTASSTFNVAWDCDEVCTIVTSSSVKSEVLEKISQAAVDFPYVRPRVGPAVGARVEPPAAEEQVLDEFVVRVEAQRLVIDEAAFRPPRDDEPRHAEAVSGPIDGRRHDVVEQPAPLIPRDEDRGAVPIRS